MKFWATLGLSIFTLGGYITACNVLNLEMPELTFGIIWALIGLVIYMTARYIDHKKEVS
jgi:hypothetical protein